MIEFLLILISLSSLFCLKQYASFKKTLPLLIMGVVLIVLSWILASMHFGLLRGSLIMIGICSISGACVTFLPRKTLN